MAANSDWSARPVRVAPGRQQCGDLAGEGIVPRLHRGALGGVHARHRDDEAPAGGKGDGRLGRHRDEVVLQELSRNGAEDRGLVFAAALRADAAIGAEGRRTARPFSIAPRYPARASSSAIAADQVAVAASRLNAASGRKQAITSALDDESPDGRRERRPDDHVHADAGSREVAGDPTNDGDRIVGPVPRPRSASARNGMVTDAPVDASTMRMTARRRGARPARESRARRRRAASGRRRSRCACRALRSGPAPTRRARCRPIRRVRRSAPRLRRNAARRFRRHRPTGRCAATRSAHPVMAGCRDLRGAAPPRQCRPDWRDRALRRAYARREARTPRLMASATASGSSSSPRGDGAHVAARREDARRRIARCSC